MKLEQLKTKKIAIVGMGVNNRHLAEYLKSRGIAYSVFQDWKSPEELTGKIDAFDVVFRTPGLPFLSKLIQRAMNKGVEISSQTKLFFDLCPAKIIGVTGTKGKGTTATLISEILTAHGKKNWLAGNIGQDPFVFLDQITAQDFVVLELSSFQLQDLDKNPHLAVVLNITSEHLDHHKTFDEYLAAKKRIVSNQSPTDFAILNYDYPIIRDFVSSTPASVAWNSVMSPVKPGCFVKNGAIYINFDRGEEYLMPVSEIGLLGDFNLENVTAAVAAAGCAAELDLVKTRECVKRFRGLPHRLEFVAECRGVKYYDDTFSTTPETAIAAISAFDKPLILIVGGSEKNSDYSKLAQVISESKIKALIPIGITGPKIANLSRKSGFEGRIADKVFANMDEIMDEAHKLAAPGDIILLSPASASFDMFENYKQRGDFFQAAVKKFANG